MREFLDKWSEQFALHDALATGPESDAIEGEGEFEMLQPVIDGILLRAEERRDREAFDALPDADTGPARRKRGEVPPLRMNAVEDIPTGSSAVAREMRATLAYSRLS